MINKLFNMTVRFYSYNLYLPGRQCPVLPAPPNGMVLSQKQLFYFGDKVSFRCDHGYTLNGDATRTCAADGSWTDRVASCISKCASLHSNICLLCLLSGS